MKRILLVVILAAVVAGCESEANIRSEGPKNANVIDGETTLTRTYDPDYDVMCWYYQGAYGKSISCLPMSQLKPGSLK